MYSLTHDTFNPDEAYFRNEDTMIDWEGNIISVDVRKKYSFWESDDDGVKIW